MSISVLVVDDSAFMRKVISDMLNSAPGIKVVATARNGVEALEKMVKFKPRVITLDVEMPRMDGITTLKHIMVNNPTPVVMLSSLTRQGSRETLEALSLGAIDFVPKPSGAISLDLIKVREELVAKVKAAARARVAGEKIHLPSVISHTPEVRAGSVAPGMGITAKAPLLPQAQRVVAIGSSTGGPKALEQVITRLPADLPAGVLITQHMPAGFTRSMAERLDRLSSLRVKEAENGDLVRDGQVLVAPGGYHLKLDRNKKVTLSQDPPVQHVRPSVDVMMSSIAEKFRGSPIGVILTGMGKDGTQGMKSLKEVGGKTIAQDRETASIFSMPGSVIKSGYADRVVPLPDIAAQILEWLKR